MTTAQRIKLGRKHNNGGRKRRYLDSVRRAWYAKYRQERFAKRLGFGV